MTVNVTASSSPIEVAASGTTVAVSVPAAGSVSVEVGGSSGAAADHSHGNITSDGKISGASAGEILTTGANGTIQTASSLNGLYVDDAGTVNFAADDTLANVLQNIDDAFGQTASARQSSAAVIPTAPSHSNTTPVTLSPSGSAWHVEYLAVIQDDEANQNHQIKVGSFSNLSAIDGVIERTDSGGTTSILIQNATEGIGQSFTGVLRVSGFVRVTGASGVLAIGVAALDLQSNSLIRSYCVARRIA